MAKLTKTDERVLQELDNPDFYRSGKITLAKPLTIGERQITELEFDFEKVTGQSYIYALDVDKQNNNLSQLSSKQLVALMAAALTKERLDFQDLFVNLSTADMITVMQVTNLYFFGLRFRMGKNLGSLSHELE